MADNAIEVVFSFASTHGAIQAEQCLLDAALPVRVMPLPSVIRAGCGIGLRLPLTQQATALALLQAAHISPQSIHIRSVNGMASTYIEWKEDECLGT